MNRELAKKIIMYILSALLGSGITIAVDSSTSVKCSLQQSGVL